MALTIEQEAQKSKKRAKIGKIVAIVGAVLLVAWSIFMIVQNPNKDEVRLIDTLIKATEESDQPDALKLIKCTDFVKYTNTEGKKCSYVIAEMEQAGVKNTYVLITKGKKDKGKMFTTETISEMDYSGKDDIDFKIDEENPDVNIQKVNKMFTRYLKFKDRI